MANLAHKFFGAAVTCCSILVVASAPAYPAWTSSNKLNCAFAMENDNPKFSRELNKFFANFSVTFDQIKKVVEISSENAETISSKSKIERDQHGISITTNFPLDRLDQRWHAELVLEEVRKGGNLKLHDLTYAPYGARLSTKRMIEASLRSWVFGGICRDQ